MDNGFPWKRFLEGFFVVAMLLFLDPAIYWSILLPCAIHHGGYKHELLSVQYVDFGRRQGGLHAAGSIQFAIYVCDNSAVSGFESFIKARRIVYHRFAVLGKCGIIIHRTIISRGKHYA